VDRLVGQTRGTVPGRSTGLWTDSWDCSGSGYRTVALTPRVMEKITTKISKLNIFHLKDVVLLVLLFLYLQSFPQNVFTGRTDRKYSTADKEDPSAANNISNSNRFRSNPVMVCKENVLKWRFNMKMF